MDSDISNCIWDENGACLRCGFIPFKLTDECYVCNPCTNISNDIENSYDEEGNDNDVHEYDEEEPVIWEINRKKTIIIDEDKSSYQEMFESLEGYNETGDLERVHIIEDQIYRRFIKDIVVKKFTNINSIFELADKINDIIIKPNDGSWDTCRWYA